LYTYAAGTTTPLTTYFDSTGTAANTNPIILDTRGEANVWLDSSAYKFVLRTSNDTLIWTVDNISGVEALEAYILGLLAAPNGAALIGYTPTDSGGVTTVNDRLQLLDGVSATATATDNTVKGAVNAYRDASAVSGGSSAIVNTNIFARTVSGAAETSLEWTATFVLDNYSAVSDNVAMYAQGNKRSTGATWAAVVEAKDFTNAADPAAGLVGLEVDIFANGTDANNRRIGIDIVAGKGVAGGATSQTYAGIRIVPFALSTANASYVNGILMQGDHTTALNLSCSGIWGIYMSGSKAVGIDLSAGTHSQAAIRIKEKESIQFDGAGTSELVYDSTISLPGLYYGFNDVAVAGFSNSGNVFVSDTVWWTSGATATTVGAAGGASALPATPTGYVKIRIEGTYYKLPYYAD
jgi:hypothetical protein